MAKREMKTQKVEETIVEETTVVEPVEEVVEEVVEEKVIIPIGVISNCERLNIRNKPNKDGDVVKVVDAKTEVTINPGYTNKAWYKVTTADGLTGYCMKEYITIK